MSTLLNRYAAGSKPEAFVYTFTDSTGTPVTTTGYTSTVTWFRHSTGATGSFSASIDSAGASTFTVPEAVTATQDTIDLQVWAGDTTTLLDGKKWRLVIGPAAGTAPSI